MSKANSSTPKTTKIKTTDAIDINGRVYYIPDKYIGYEDIGYIGYEYIKLYKFILASVIDKHLEKNIIPNIAKITKTLLTSYINMAEKIFSHIITGKINTINLSAIETDIMRNIPSGLIPKLNPNIIERID